MTDQYGDEIDPTLPQVVQDFLRSGAQLEEIRLDAGGNWTHEGLQFDNRRIIDLFSKNVGRTEGGTWVLEIGRFTYPIVVEDTGFFIERADWAASPPRLELSDGTRERLDIDSLQYAGEGKLYCRVKEGRFRARFKRPAYHSIIDHLRERDGEIVVVLGDREITLGSTESPDDRSAPS